jgi:hypothetical protein
MHFSSTKVLMSLLCGLVSRGRVAAFRIQHQVATKVTSSRRAVTTPTASDTETELPFKLEDIVNLCKRRGFVFQSSEIYSPMAGFFDFGPLGHELKNNV